MRVGGGLAEGVGTTRTREEEAIYVDVDVGIGVSVGMWAGEAIMDEDWCAGTCLRSRARCRCRWGGWRRNSDLCSHGC